MPITLNPVYIAIKVKIGCTPIFLLTNFGSKICLATDMIINNTMMAIPKFRSPFIAQRIAQGIITVPEPKIGKASTKPINNAINNGYWTLKPVNSNIYNPIKDKIKDTKIRLASAFRYPPKSLDQIF